MVINVTVVGPFEEEEEGTGITSDVVKVMGEDPVTPDLLPKGIDPGTVTIPQYRVNKTKQHTPVSVKCHDCVTGTKIALTEFRPVPVLSVPGNIL